jgi:hypothetical protein
MRAIFALGVAAFALAGCQGAGRSYSASAEETYHKLAKMPVPETLDNYLFSAGAMKVRKDPGKSISWVFGKPGREVGSITATITPESETSARVIVAVDPPPESKGSFKTADAQKVINGVMKPVMEEQVNATLDDREFNDQVLVQTAVAFTMLNQGTILRKGMEAQHEYEKDMRASRESRMSYSHAKETYEDAQRSAGKPMVDVRPGRF